MFEKTKNLGLVGAMLGHGANSAATLAYIKDAVAFEMTAPAIAVLDEALA